MTALRIELDTPEVAQGGSFTGSIFVEPSLAATIKEIRVRLSNPTTNTHMKEVRLDAFVPLVGGKLMAHFTYEVSKSCRPGDFQLEATPVSKGAFSHKGAMCFVSVKVTGPSYPALDHNPQYIARPVQLQQSPRQSQPPPQQAQMQKMPPAQYRQPQQPQYAQQHQMHQAQSQQPHMQQAQYQQPHMQLAQYVQQAQYVAQPQYGQQAVMMQPVMMQAQPVMMQAQPVYVQQMAQPQYVHHVPRTTHVVHATRSHHHSGAGSLAAGLAVGFAGAALLASTRRF